LLHEGNRHPFGVVHPVALAIERTGQPVAEIDHPIDRVAWRLAIDVHQLVAKREIVDRHRHRILRAPRRGTSEASRVLREAADAHSTICPQISIHPIVAADQLVQHHVDIDVQPAGMGDRHRALELLAVAETGLD